MKINLWIFFFFLFNTNIIFSQTSQTSVGKTSGSFLSKAIPDRATYFSIFSGPSLGDLSDPVDEEGELQEGSVTTWNQVSIQWNLSKKTRLVINPRFVINNNPTDDETQTYEHVSPVIGITSTWFKKGGFQFSGGLNTITPLSRQESHNEENLAFNPGGFNSLRYKVNSRVNLGMWIWGRLQIYEAGKEEDQDRLPYFYAPKVDYNINDTNTVSAFYQYNGAASNNYTFENEVDDSLNILYSFTLNKYFTIEPMITLFRKSDYDSSKANINIWLSGRVF